MFLRSLTIKGFKSFARKTVLEFEPGVTIIVGPNGSGKSNIADAVMWVLGEQSPTSLRGNRMEDIIFAGSSSLKPVNLAEVTLTLDNSNNDFPLDYSEVTITRNVVRGGDSEYRLNNSACRLLDIQELLSDAGVGRTLNSVISQGALDDVLSCRPEERRDYIEEAGGLLKFRKRREKAMRRLARMDEELLRTNDVAREVRRQLRPLQRQAGRLEQYTGLVREMKEARLRLDVARLRAMRREWEEHQARQQERSEKLEALDALLVEKAAEASDLEKRQAEWRAREEEVRKGLYRLVSLHERLKAMLVLWDEKARHSRQEAASLPAPDPAELERVTSENAALEKQRDEVTQKIESMRAREAELARQSSELKARLNELARHRAAAEGRIEAFNETLFAEGGLAADRLQQKREELARLTEEREDIAAGIDPLQQAAERARLAMAELADRLESLAPERDPVLEELREEDRRQAGLTATLEILTRLETEEWGPLNTSTSLLEDDPTDGGLGGMLASSIRIDPAHETAINSYLGPWLCGIIARDTNAIIVAIEHLKEKGLGQGLFFRHDAAAAAPERSRRLIEGASPARDAVQAPDWFADALDALLEDVYMADDLDGAVALAETHPHLVFLSPDGDVISGGSMIKGGSPTVNPVTLEMSVDRRRKLEDALASSREATEGLELRRAAIDSEIRGLTDEAAHAREESITAAEALISARAEVAGLETRIESLRGDLAPAGNGEGVETAASDPEAQVARLEELRAEEAEVAQSFADCDGQARENAGALRAADSELASVTRRLEIGRIKERDMRARSGGPAGSGRRPEIADEDLSMLITLHERLTGQSQAARERLRDEADIGVDREKKAADGLHQLREEASQRQRDHDTLRDLIHEEDLARAELKVRVEQLVERIVDENKVPLEFALKTYPDEEPTGELEARLAELTGQLEHIGPVNPEAITERESLEQRHDFLKTQMDDIDQARTQLKRVLKQIDREIEQRFTETLEAVDGHFQKIFSGLFPNGSAQLRLTDPDDILGSGVEIMAQPEGKKLRRISLLSGGETSLTALAFFFSLFKVRPSPFYFLDEVEAALDDVNLHRFLDLVKEFKDESQLVLITHQKRSMETADVLYGVTMHDDGMSRVVSQRLVEQAAS
ncbi:MAG TPA: chromosome segregation protein SMC [Candidatus Anoxymicrobiaceae bacterium]